MRRPPSRPSFLHFFTKCGPSFCSMPLDRRRLFCYNVDCKAKAFTNLAKGWAAPWQRIWRSLFCWIFTATCSPKRQREVMEQYYNDDLSLAEIADNFGITRQGVRDSIKRGEGIILDLEQKVGFAARYRAVQQGVAQLEEPGPLHPICQLQLLLAQRGDRAGRGPDAGGDPAHHRLRRRSKHNGI